MTFRRTKESINKEEDAGTAHGQISSTDALQRVFPTTVSIFSHFVAGSARRPCATEVQ